jgi:hypothetical protein
MLFFSVPFVQKMLLLITVIVGITCYECLRRRKKEKAPLVQEKSEHKLNIEYLENKEYFVVVQSPMSDKDWDLIV